MAYVPQLAAIAQLSFESGVDAANVLCDRADPPTAIFAANDDMAAAVYRVAGERGLRVPRDLSVCGFDDTPIAGHIYPALTTVRQPTAHMGRLATEQLIEHIRAEAAGGVSAVEHAVVERGSAGAARGRWAVPQGADAPVVASPHALSAESRQHVQNLSSRSVIQAIQWTCTTSTGHCRCPALSVLSSLHAEAPWRGIRAVSFCTAQRFSADRLAALSCLKKRCRCRSQRQFIGVSRCMATVTSRPTQALARRT